MSNEIEGVPEGYEFVRIGQVHKGEYRVLRSGKIDQWDGNVPSNYIYPVLRKKSRVQDTYKIPDGFRVLGPDEVCKRGDYFIGSGHDTPYEAEASIGMTQKQAEKQWEGILLLRKIEKPKQYRPFANAEEFKPHKHRWVRMKNGTEGNSYPITGSSNTYVWIGPVTTGMEWDRALRNYVFDDDGSPFGIICEDQ